MMNYGRSFRQKHLEHEGMDGRTDGWMAAQPARYESPKTRYALVPRCAGGGIVKGIGDDDLSAAVKPCRRGPGRSNYRRRPGDTSPGTTKTALTMVPTGPARHPPLVEGQAPGFGAEPVRGSRCGISTARSIT